MYSKFRLPGLAQVNAVAIGVLLFADYIQCTYCTAARGVKGI